MFPSKLTEQPVCNKDWPLAETEQGTLRGLWREGGFIFRGINYAKAERFHMPEEPDSWEGVRNAVTYGPVCREISTSVPKDAFTVPHFWYPQSENCQNLNIWTQTLDPCAKRPVMVWIHGGGLEHGSDLEIYSYDGEELSKFGNVVVVSVNHRLNVLGYMDLSDYGPEYANSGNLGTADLVAALEWIHKNIASFGGDPDNVMLFGQSGGAGKILTLMQTPAADGLYCKVALDSGVKYKTVDVTHEMAAEKTELVLSSLGITADNIKEIETVPFHKLADAVNEAYDIYGSRHNGERMQWTVVADGKYYAGHPYCVGFRKETLNIPMIIGTCLGEFFNNVIDPEKYDYPPKSEWTEEITSKRLSERFGDDADAVREAFRKAYPDRPDADALYVDSRMRPEHTGIAKLRAATPGAAPVYNYLLTLELPADGGSTPWHNAEEAFIFHNASYIESTYIPGVTDTLQDIMCGAWVAFAYSGNPNHPGLPTWPRVTEETLPTMLFDSECSVGYDHDRELMEILTRLGLAPVGDKGGPERIYGGSPRYEI